VTEANLSRFQAKTGLATLNADISTGKLTFVGNAAALVKAGKMASMLANMVGHSLGLSASGSAVMPSVQCSSNVRLSF
jgi:hypothetical protein